MELSREEIANEIAVFLAGLSGARAQEHVDDGVALLASAHVLVEPCVRERGNPRGDRDS